MKKKFALLLVVLAAVACQRSNSVSPKTAKSPVSASQSASSASPSSSSVALPDCLSDYPGTHKYVANGKKIWITAPKSNEDDVLTVQVGEKEINPDGSKGDNGWTTSAYHFGTGAPELAYESYSGKVLDTENSVAMTPCSELNTGCSDAASDNMSTIKEALAAAQKGDISKGAEKQADYTKFLQCTSGALQSFGGKN
jgi:hypothetical protein